MCDENFFTRKAEGGVFICSALAVGNERIKLADKPSPRLTLFWRTQPPAEYFSSAFAHPLNRGWRCQIARIRFHDQGIGIPFFEPVNKSALMAEIE